MSLLAECYPGSAHSETGGEYETINIQNYENNTYVTDAELAYPEYITDGRGVNSAPYNPDAQPQTPPWPRATTQGTSEDYPYSYADGRTIPFVQQLSHFASEPAYCDVAVGSSR